jgi:hypothetical protein
MRDIRIAALESVAGNPPRGGRQRGKTVARMWHESTFRFGCSTNVKREDARTTGYRVESRRSRIELAAERPRSRRSGFSGALLPILDR